MPRLLLLTVLLGSLVLVGCGGKSKEDKAISQVCSARADISKQVNKLSNLSLSANVGTEVKDALNAIKNDLASMADAHKDLAADRKQEVQTATQDFTNQIASIASDLTSGLTVAEAQTKVQSALTQLGNSYKQTLGTIKCPSGN